MIERQPNTGKFKDAVSQIANVYQEAFAGFPWYEDLSFEEILRRISSNMGNPGFESFLAENTEGEIIGGLWFDQPSIRQLEEERGKSLTEFTGSFCEANGIQSVIWERELIIRPDNQRQGIATRLRLTFLAYLAEKFPEGALVLTRMRDDNIGTITIAEKLGYQRTGIRIPSSQKPNIFHEYWYKAINIK